MQGHSNIQGLSLIELMVALAIIGIISAVGIPFYQNYIAAANAGVMDYNIQTINLLQDDRKVDEGEFVQGSYNPADPDAATGLKNVLGWSPGTDTGDYSYLVVCTAISAAPPECTRASGYTITATHLASGDTIVRTF